MVFGKADTAPVDLSVLGAGGFRLDGIDPIDASGASVSGAGDVNGDGLADLIVGANGADPGGDSYAGETYVVFSPSASPPVPTWKGWAKAGDAPALALGLTGDGSNDSTPDSRCWVDFAAGSGPGLSGASSVTVTRELGPSVVTNLEGALPVVWEIASDRTGAGASTVVFKYLASEAGAADQAHLTIFHAGTASGPWEKLVTDVDTARQRVSASTALFGFFAIVDATPLPLNGFKID